MIDENGNFDIFERQLLQAYTMEEGEEIKRYLEQWDRATYVSVAQNVLDHANRKGIEPLKLLRKAHNFNRRRAIRIPKTGYRWDGSVVYRKGNEYLIVRLDKSRNEKIVTYGVNAEDD